MKPESRDENLLKRCLKLAEAAQAMDEVPVGALIAHTESGQILSEAYNLKEKHQSPLGHAEVIAIHRACKKLGTWRLSGYSLYTSLEPCVMCSAVIVQSRLDRVIFSATDLKGGGQSLMGLLDHPKTNHRVDWEQGPWACESELLLKSFFRERRSKGSDQSGSKLKP